MKVKVIAFSIGLILALQTVPVNAIPGRIPKPNMQEQENLQKKEKRDRSDLGKDPIAALESKKKEIQELLKNGKITEEKAKEWLERIDQKIADIKAFDKLPLEAKKEKLINDCKTLLDQKVKEGKLDAEKANTILKDYAEMIKNWDGNGYPFFHGHRKHRD